MVKSKGMDKEKIVFFTSLCFVHVNPKLLASLAPKGVYKANFFECTHTLAGRL